TVYLNNEKWGYQYQHVRNMLQINNGIGVNQPLSFSEVGSLAEVYETDWSWSALFADYDNDGDKDALITNGFPKDITDKDFSNYRNDVGLIASPWMIVDSIPVVKVSNFAFEATGDLTFKKSTKEWGMDIPSFSNGAAFADLDLDGDLDYVVNNINDPAFIYENLSEKKKGSSNYLRVALKGPSGNPDALGSKIRIVTQGKAQYHDQSIYRGYLSTVESVAHFGLGSVTQVDSLLVRWPDGTISIKTNIAANQVLTLNHTDAKQMNIPIVPASKLKPYFKKEASATLSFKHSEMDKIDYNIQRTLPHKFSQSGPALSVGDVDGNGLEDVVIGGSSEQPTTIFYQVSKSVFRSKSVSEVSPKPFEDEGLLLFDADNDNDLDLYIVSGSFEYEPNSPNYQDRLYRNDGSGNLVRDSKALPALTSSGSCVRAADFDQDGVLDLMVGGRIIPGQYPLTPVSYLLRNNNGLFEDVTDSLCPQLKKVGMVSDAIWTDFNDDGKVDLLVVGEFMAPTFFTNTGSKLEPLANSGLENYSGWWMSVTGGDFDNDGDTDYVVGNVGTNNYFKASVERPLRVYAKDIDGNGSADAVLSCYFISPDGSLKEYPVHFWDELSQQSPKFRRKFSKYRSYAARTMDNLFTEEEKKDMVVLQANWLSSSLILNEGNGKFSVRALPKSVQRAPMNGMTSMDVNSDGFLDIVSVGNDYGNEVFMGRYDAGTGDVLIGDGRGNFKNIVSRESGLFVPGDAKALVRLPGDDKNQLLISQNKDSLKVFSYSSSGQNLPVGAQDAVVRYELPGAKKVKLEVYYGSGFGSQSSRLVTLPLNATKITIQDYKGAIRDANQVVVKK
ncbi:MAG: FG-GAP-like repeat-containing protein, partial [Cyclobacteriaceae bacterium]|nr:FG-GAP-like repeat-containing protein [Cyclobacteriaceae bacterium]